MSTKHTSAEKRTDRTELTDTELAALKDRAGEAITGRELIGIDADGAIHFWSVTEGEIAVFDSVADTDPQIVDADQLADPRLRAWAIHVARKRGKWRDLRLSYRTAAQLEQ